MYAQVRVTRSRRGGRKNAARLAKAERAKGERAKAEGVRGERVMAERAKASARAEKADVLADIPIYAYAPARPAAPVDEPFEQEARELVAYLSTKVAWNGEEWLTEEEIGDELIQTAGEYVCANETAILDEAALGLKELILLSLASPLTLLTAVSVARRALTRLAAPSVDGPHV